VKKLMAEYPNKIKLILKNYPYRYRDYSHLAAEALLAAGDQGKYWEMHDKMIEHSPKLDRDSLISYAEELKLDVKRFTIDLDSMKHKKTIEQDENLAVSMDLYNTPTFFINGRKVIGNRPYEYMKKIIEEELAHVEK
jgi:protein-disulfide isomerase